MVNQKKKLKITVFFYQDFFYVFQNTSRHNNKFSNTLYLCLKNLLRRFQLKAIIQKGVNPHFLKFNFFVVKSFLPRLIKLLSYSGGHFPYRDNQKTITKIEKNICKILIKQLEFPQN